MAYRFAGPLAAVTLALAALVSTVAASGARADTLGGVLAEAYEHSGLLEQNRALLRAADEDVAQAVSALLPVVSWSASATYGYPDGAGTDFTSANIGISSSLLLYDAGASQFAIDAQKETVLATRQELIGIEQQVLLRAVQAYMNVRREAAFLNLRQNNVRVITQELRAARDRFEVGEVTRTDVSLAEARLASARSQLAAAEGSLAQAAEEFRAAVGRRPGQLAAVSPAPISRGLAEAKAFAVRNHPDMIAAQHNVSAAELNIRRAEAAMQPSVTFSAQIGLDQDFDDSGSVGITASGPIYQGGRLSSVVRQAMARRDAVRSGIHIARHAVEQNVANAYAVLDVARASKIAFQGQVRASQVAFQGVREEATLGARTTLEVLNAEQELLDARANLVSAEVDEIIASYQVLFAMGLLTVEDLRLGVQTYDPAAYYNLVSDAPPALSEQGQALDRVLRAIGE